MKILVVLGFLLFTTTLRAAAPSLATVREMYLKANENEKICKELLSTLQPYTEKNNPLLFGYKASGTMMMAQHVSNPFSRLSYFKDGKKMLEKAIAAAPQDVELRFLRFNIQANAPSFLDYSDELKTDKAFILQKLPSMKDAASKHFIVSFLKKSDRLTPAEKQKL